jgi:putative nucleotidyltransferase with HDIG domain
MTKKNKMMNEKKEKAKNPFFSAMAAYIKKYYPFLILLFFGLLVVSALYFAKVTTVETVAGFDIDNYEIGQISDRTIIADRTILPDSSDPIMIQKGEKIIKNGFPITDEDYAKLKKMSSSPKYIDYRAFANGELAIIILAIFWFLLYSTINFHRKIRLKEPLLQVILFAIVFAVTAFCLKLSFFSSSYSICIVIPATLCVVLIAILYGNLSAVLFSFILALGVLIASNWQLPTFLYVLSTSLSSAAIVHKTDKRLQLIWSGLLIAIINIAFMLLFMVVFNEKLTGLLKLFLGVFANGFLTGVLTLGLLTPLEAMLNTASVFRLMDLSNTDNPVLKQMQIQANGTYYHSMNVALLAENACREIGANALLAKVGAYFHDIGKIDQSEYFVENQANGENKLIELNPTLSASVIKSHVKKGVEKARQMHLPLAVIDIISEHHGNSVITYFYNEGKVKDDTLQPEDFSYPGNPPSTKESAIVMLADTVEAACRTLENPTAPRLEKFISTLINAKVEHKQLDNCDLTFRDLSKIKESFVHILTGQYHNRIKYQNQQDPDSEENKAEAPVKPEAPAPKVKTEAPAPKVKK